MFWPHEGEVITAMTSGDKHRSRGESTCLYYPTDCLWPALGTVERARNLLRPEPSSPLTLGAVSSQSRPWRSLSPSPCTLPSYVFHASRQTLQSATYLQSAQGKPTSVPSIWIPAPRPCSEQCRHRGSYSDGNVKPRADAHPKRHSHPALCWQRTFPPSPSSVY